MFCKEVKNRRSKENFLNYFWSYFIKSEFLFLFFWSLNKCGKNKTWTETWWHFKFSLFYFSSCQKLFSPFSYQSLFFTVPSQVRLIEDPKLIYCWGGKWNKWKRRENNFLYRRNLVGKHQTFSMVSLSLLLLFFLSFH